MLIRLHDYIEKQNLLGQSWKGIVVDNADPLELRRIKVTIAGLLEGDAENLPWATYYSTLPTSTLGGLHIIPKIGDQVEITFPINDIYFPQYSGNIYNSATKNTVFTGDKYLNAVGFSYGNLSFVYKNSTSDLELTLGTSQISIKGTEIKLVANGSELHLKDGKVALGSSEELLDLLSQVCDQLSQSLGNLGYPLSNSAQFTALKAKVDSIKGAL